VTERLLVEAPDADSALSLVDEFKDLHAELVPIDGGRCEVQVELERDRERQLRAALAAVERWLASSGIEATRVKLGERSYTVERPGSSAATAASREQRLAKNEVLFREVNERIEQAAKDASFEGPMVFVCECGNVECAETIEVTLAKYEAVRSQPTLFLIVPGHETDDFTRVLEQNERFAVVEKVGEAGAIAQRHDPRA